MKRFRELAAGIFGAPAAFVRYLVAPSPCSPAQLQIGGTMCSSGLHIFCSEQPVSESRLSSQSRASLEPVWSSRFDLAIWRGPTTPQRVLPAQSRACNPPTCRTPAATLDTRNATRTSTAAAFVVTAILDPGPPQTWEGNDTCACDSGPSKH